MSRKETFVRTGKTDAATGCELVEITVKVKDKEAKGLRRLFTTVDQLGGLTDDECLKLCNYAEDLFVRAKITRENTDQTGKKAMRQEAMNHWKANDKGGFTELLMRDGITQAQIDAALETYYAEHLAE